METYEIRANANVWQLRVVGAGKTIASVSTRAQALQIADGMFANKSALVRLLKPNGRLDMDRIYPLTVEK